MANTTAHGALSIHGTNPQFLVERVIRTRIYDSTYWKQDCFALTAATLVDKAAELTYVGGTYGMLRPSPFLCLVCKLLQIQPEKSVIEEYLAADDLKYLRAVAAMYVRLTYPSMDVYETLEPMLNDYRKLRWRDMTGQYSLSHMDEFIDQLLTEERVCDLILPRLTKRTVLEANEGLRPRRSRLEEAMVLGDAQGLESGSESDDSLAALRQERRERDEHADRVRAERQARLTRARAEAASGSDEGYASQQSASDEEKLHARLQQSRSPSPAFRSRSPSRSPSPAFRSRSPSRSVSPA